MAFVRTKFDIEYEADDGSRDSSRGGALWIVAALVAVAAAVFAIRHAFRLLSGGDGAPPNHLTAETTGETPMPHKPAAEPPNRPAAEPPGQTAPTLSAMDMVRPKKVRNLLLRMKEAESKGDIEMQVMAIWQLRELPGDPAADLVSDLTPKLGELNMVWLFGRKNPKWVSQVEVKSGDTPLRIAGMHGSTLASMSRLNGWGAQPPPIRPGEKLYVMERPRFGIVARRKTGEVDLYLSGRLFKRYATRDGKAAPAARSGQYSTSAPAGGYLSSKGFALSKKDSAELDMLVPQGTSVNID